MLPEEIEGQIPLKEEVKITLENKKFYCILLGNYKEQRIIDIGPLTMLKEDLEDPINYRFSGQYKYSDIKDIQLRFPPKEPDKNNNKSLIKKISDLGFSEKIVSAVVRGVNQEISKLEVITLDTMAGMTGGGVGRVKFAHENKNYVVKIHTNKKVADKFSIIPTLIHKYAKENDDQLAHALSRRITKQLFSTPVEQNGYHLTIEEETTQQVLLNQFDTAIIMPELRKGLDLQVLERLYTAALFHEVIGEVLETCDEKTKEKITCEVLPTNLKLGKIIHRFNGNYKQIKSKFCSTIKPIYWETHEELLTQETKGTTIGLYDNKAANYIKSVFVDFGLAKKGNEINDITRAIKDDPRICKDNKLMTAYVDAYISIRQRLQQTTKGQVTYTPNKTYLQTLVKKQTQIDTWRTAAWHAYSQPNNTQKFENAVNCAQSTFNMN